MQSGVLGQGPGCLRHMLSARRVIGSIGKCAHPASYVEGTEELRSAAGDRGARGLQREWGVGPVTWKHGYTVGSESG